MAVLLLASLLVMMFYARTALKEEAMQKASQTLEGTVQHIDNILLSVEQTAGNFYFRMLPDLRDKEKMYAYTRQVLESNPYVVGCAIAFKTGFYQDGEDFMAYHYRSDSTHIVRTDTFADSPYTKQEWFVKTMEANKPGWMKPLANEHYQNLIQEGGDATTVITFCLPIYYEDNKPLGVLGVDVSLSLLSRIVLDTKPTKNSYCTLLDAEGSFIVHPNSDKLFYQNVFTQMANGEDPSVEVAAKAMVSGETGYKQFRMYGKDFNVFYKPFRRSFTPGRVTGDLGWSAGIIYPHDDIFGDYNNLRYYMMAIAFVGLLILLLSCRAIIHRQLQPLLMLTHSAQRIANGHYDETIPDSRQKDEIGRLQNNFQQLQQSLSAYIRELEQATATLKERGEGLRVAYNQAQKAERMKTAFLHNMTNQLVAPSEAIERDVNALCNLTIDERREAALVEDLQENGNIIAELLDDLIKISDEEKRKGGDYD